MSSPAVYPRRMQLLFPLLLLLPCATHAQAKSASRPAITGISHLTLFADDLAKSQRFYGGLLGWVQVPAAAPRPGVRFYDNHSQYVELLPAPKADLADRLDIVAFSTPDAEALRSFLGSHGVSVPPSVTVEKDGNRSFLVRDPEGNRIGFTQPNGNAPQRPASAQQPLGTRIIHAGFVVRNREAEDHFYKDLLGFRLYWQGGQKDGSTDYVAMQVPDGSDWLEYMLNMPADPSRGQLGVANHFAPGVVSVAQTLQALEQRGWKPSSREHDQVGRDGKRQLNLYDPDGTRVEFMEFQPVKSPCCAPFTRPHPSQPRSW